MLEANDIVMKTKNGFDGLIMTTMMERVKES